MPAPATLWPLLIQAALTIITIDLLRRSVFARYRHLDATQLLTDVWAPLAIVAPMMFFIARSKGTVIRGESWMTLGAPICCGILAVGVAAVAARRDEAARFTLNPLTIAVWSGAGLLLLLIGAAHDLTLWVGQCAFALVAVLLWINTPEIALEAKSDNVEVQSRAGCAMIIAAMCALGQGVAFLYTSHEAAPISAVMMMAGATMALASAARWAGVEAAIRIGGWTMAYGVLLGIGLLSVERLIAESLNLIHEHEVQRVFRIAQGFGAYAYEATAAILMAAAAIVTLRLPHAARRIVGLALMVGAATLAAWRISQF